MVWNRKTKLQNVVQLILLETDIFSRLKSIFLLRSRPARTQFQNLSSFTRKMNVPFLFIILQVFSSGLPYCY